MTSSKLPFVVIIVAVAAVAGLMTMPLSSNLAADQYVALDDENYAEEVLSFATKRGEDIKDSEVIVRAGLPVVIQVLDMEGRALGTLNIADGTFISASEWRYVPYAYEATGIYSPIGSAINAGYYIEPTLGEELQYINYSHATSFIPGNVYADDVYTSGYVIYANYVKETTKVVDGKALDIVILVGDGFKIEARANATPFEYQAPAECIEFFADAAAYPKAAEYNVGFDVGYEHPTYKYELAEFSAPALTGSK